MQGYTNTKDQKVEGLGGNLKYYQADFIPKSTTGKTTDEDKLLLAKKVGCMLALKENTFDELENTDFYQVFGNQEKRTGIYFRENKAQLEELVQKLASSGKAVKLYIFSWMKGEYKSAFSEYPNITCEDIPDPILEVYKHIGLI